MSRAPRAWWLEFFRTLRLRGEANGRTSSAPFGRGSKTQKFFLPFFFSSAEGVGGADKKWKGNFWFCFAVSKYLTFKRYSYTLHHMVNNRVQNLDRIFSALANSTRRGIMTKLTYGELTVGELSKPYRISPPAISKHLAILEKTNLIITKKEGRYIICSLQPKTLRDATQWLAKYEKFWGRQFINLGKHLNK